MIASLNSQRLCGGMLVAIPTAMPMEPFARTFGQRDGRLAGSSSSPS
jgi:hypothetical protein